MIIEKRETSLNPPLAIPAVLFASGIILGNIIVSYFYFVLFVSILSLFLFLYYKKQNNSKNLLFLFLFIFLSGFIFIIPHLPQSFETKSISDYFGEKDLKVFGMIVSKPKQKNIRTKFVLKINKIKREQDNKAKKVTGRIELYSYQRSFQDNYQETPKLQYGDLISFTGSIRKPRNFSNPGGFDYVKYL
ncbi:MAG: DUF4131 domain-containing protein, partial [Desulfobacteraceae bacterium]|nr:DUF4131 domain-containing protein [Desulfobacteraceae bacterium]